MASVAVPVIAMPRALARGHPRDAKAPRVVRGGPIGHRVLRRGRVAARAVEEATSTSTSPSPASSSPTDCLPDADDALPDAVVEFLRRDGRHASFSSVKVGSIEVDEVNGGRSLREYMSLPASQYSTLDGEKVERVGDDTFVCTLGSFDFLGFKLQPVLTARVDVRPDGCVQYTLIPYVINSPSPRASLSTQPPRARTNPSMNTQLTNPSMNTQLTNPNPKHIPHITHAGKGA